MEDKTKVEYTVYHGGSLMGLGRWSGPHATRREAEESADECSRIVGGSPIIKIEKIERGKE